MASSATNPNPSNHTNSAPISPVFITTESLHSILSHHILIQHFHTSLPTVSSSLHTPIRQIHEISRSSSLLLMPSWSTSPSLPFTGVKLVTYFPQNSSINLPGIHASYVLFSSTTGQTLASTDGTVLTLYRTSCVSGLASNILAREDSQVLVMVGAGALAPHLIKAHLAARPSLRKETMRECDDEAIKRGRVFVDNEAALVEAEELVGAIERGVIDKKDVGFLVDLIKGDNIGRRNPEEITVFKSVGSAVVDILAAQLVYEGYVKSA
ncbi:hypothetical protein Tsubulata_041511 [Turnera subulata]|uniref:Ornithine cyclodeaminase n=1 Tax=Turnera subulata TaxID=218843 RepID=A0A9Q0JFF3_9ROSI|nr:hypothetical protein Tsubulata_041511 [Turnera subulata]